MNALQKSTECGLLIFKFTTVIRFNVSYRIYYYYYYYYYYLESAVQGRERVRTLSVQRPKPHTANPWKEEEEDKIVGDTKERADHAKRKALALLLKPASPTPSNTGSLRSFQWDTERSTKVLRYWEVLQRGGSYECLWATKAPQVTRAGTYSKGNAPLKGCIGLLLILNSMHNSATDRRWARLHSKTPPARKSALLTNVSSSLRCESAAEHHTAEQYSKTGRTKLQKYLRRSDQSWNTCQDFFMIPSLWAAALEIERRCFSKIILASKVTPNITRLADSFSTVPSRVNVINRGWIMRDLETIIVLVLLAFSFIPHKLHHTTTLFRSRFIDSETVSLSPGDGTTTTGMESSA